MIVAWQKVPTSHAPAPTRIDAFFREEANSGTRWFVEALADAFVNTGWADRESGAKGGEVSS